MPTLINRSINLDQSKRFVDTIFLTQGEGGATTLNFTLMQSGAVIDLTGCTVNFLAKKPSGATLTNACTLTNAAQGKVAYVVTTQTAIEAGALTDARLSVIKSGVAWKSFKFNVTVEAVPDYSTAIQSTNEFTTLQSLTSQITASTTAIGTLASLLTTAKTNLVAAINELFTSKADKSVIAQKTALWTGAANSGVLTFSENPNNYQFLILRISDAADGGTARTQVFDSAYPTGTHTVPIAYNNTQGTIRGAYSATGYAFSSIQAGAYLISVTGVGKIA